MSERKVLNKYYPPDFDPSKIPRMKLPKNRQYTVRLMAPFNMRCKTCGEYIYKGKKFNARKEDVDNDTYLGIRIYRFYIKCTRCLQEISFKTDPKNTDYEIEAGATRNFMALKLAEEQARREEEEAREEEANNPMKLLENRTQQSRNEIELLESLEELRDLNQRQQAVDYTTMLQQFNTEETERQRIEREEREDEEFIKSVKFSKKGESSKRIIVEEIIEDIKFSSEDEPPVKLAKTIIPTVNTLKPPSLGIKNQLGIKKKQPLVIVKPKLSQMPTSIPTKPSEQLTSRTTSSLTPEQPPNDKSKPSSSGGLSLLSAYSDSSENSD